MTDPGIELEGLAKSFGEVHAVRGVDVSIAPGEIVALLGPNGAGKSTTIDMLLGLTRPDRGRVSVFGLEPSTAIDRGMVGAMLQSGALIRDLTVRELVDMVASLYPSPYGVDEVLTLAGCVPIADRRTQKLSGGQTQRVRFAVAVVSNPELLVLDEPTAAMDVEARHGFWISMRTFAARGKTVLFATHYLEEADAHADRIVLMAAGRIVALLSIVLLYGAGLTLGVHLAPAKWLTMTVLILIGLIPFNVLGILLGHLLTADAVGPAVGGLVSLFALLGGMWGPIGDQGFMHSLSQSLPSFWLVEAGRSALGGELWPGKGWLVIVVWSVVLGRLAARAYRRDTQRQS